MFLKISKYLLLFISLTCNSYAGINYIIQENDDLKIISKKIYHSDFCWTAIYRANKKKLIKSIKLSQGRKIFIPSRINCNKKPNKERQKKLEARFKQLSQPLNVKPKPKAKKKPSKKPSPKVSDPDKNYWSLRAEINPIKYRRINKEKDISYGLNLSYNKDEYELSLRADRSAFSSSDELSGITVSADDKNALFTFDINNFFGRFTYFNLLYYNQEQSGEIYTTKHKIRTGPIGIKFDIIEEKKYVDEFSLSFIPLYEYIIENVEEVGNLGDDLAYIESTTTNIRASLRMRWKLKYKDFLKMKITTFYRPAYPLDDNEYNSKDIAFENKVKLGYVINEHVSFGYINLFSYDIRKKTIHHLPSSDMEHTYLAEFSYDF